MSRIFDALQQFEAERTRKATPAVDSPRDGLERNKLQESAKRLYKSLGDAWTESQSIKQLLSAEERSRLSGTPVVSVITPAVHTSPTDVFSQFGTLVTGVSPSSRLVCFTEKDSPAAEAFRLLGVRLKHLQRDRALKSVLITSTVPNEGKTFTAANLACALAMGSPEKVLLVDGDLRRPSIARLLGLKATPGLSEWLRGKTGLTSTIFRLNAVNIWVLPSGCLPSNSLETLESGQLSALMDELKTWFGWVVIDSPPILPLADTSVWARVADGVLLVTRKDVTEKNNLQRGMEAFDATKLLGAILNSSRNPMSVDAYYYRSAVSP